MISFNDELVHCDLNDEERSKAEKLNVVALKQIDKVDYFASYLGTRLL